MLAALTPERARRDRRGGARRASWPSTPMRGAAPRSTRCCGEVAGARGARHEAARMKLVVLGLSLSSSWGNGHATTYRALLQGLRRARPRRPVPGARRALVRGASRPRRPGLSAASNSTGRSPSSQRWRDEIAQRRRGRSSAPTCPRASRSARWVQRTARGVTAFYDIDTPVTLAKLERRRRANTSRPS